MGKQRHAGNSVYTLVGGEVAGIPIGAGEWTRLDLTTMDTGRMTKLALKYVKKRQELHPAVLRVKSKSRP